MPNLEIHIGQAGSSAEFFGHHPTDRKRHPFAAAAVALVRGGPEEARTVFNQRHHPDFPDFAQNAGDGGFDLRLDIPPQTRTH